MGFSDLGKKLSKIGQDTKNGVQKVSDSVTISNRISQEKKSLERLFALIGEAVYKEHPDQPKAGLEDEWAAVKVAYANIASYTEQLNNVKGIFYCPNCGRPAAPRDKYCAKCGFRLNMRPETTGVKVARDIKEAGQEVGRMAGNAADKTGEAVGGAAAETQNVFFRLKEKMLPRKKKGDDSTLEALEKTSAAAGISVDVASAAENIAASGEAKAVENMAASGDAKAAESFAASEAAKAEESLAASEAAKAEENRPASGVQEITHMWRRTNVQIPKRASGAGRDSGTHSKENPS